MVQWGIQREIFNAADTATRLYCEATPDDRRSVLEIWDTLTKAHDRLIINILSQNFEKYITAAYKDNGEDCFLEVPPLLCVFFAFIFVLFLL